MFPRLTAWLRGCAYYCQHLSLSTYFVVSCRELNWLSRGINSSVALLRLYWAYILLAAVTDICGLSQVEPRLADTPEEWLSTILRTLCLVPKKVPKCGLVCSLAQVQITTPNGTIPEASKIQIPPHTVVVPTMSTLEGLYCISCP